MCMVILFGEMTNPFNIWRKNFLYEGKEKLAKYCEIIFGVLFLILRVPVASLIVKPIAYSRLPLAFKCIVCLVYFVGLFWSLMIFQMILKAIKDVRNFWPKNFFIDCSFCWKNL